ncbi:hypothetical protein OQA88_7424 [Cercophora sp. LCS_1]
MDSSPVVVAVGDGPPQTTDVDVEDMDTMDMGPYLLRVIWVLAGLSTLLLGLRLYSKLWRRRPLWWDDHVLVAAWLSLMVSVALQTAGVVHGGLGRPYTAVTHDQLAIMSVLSISAGFGSILAASWSKTSFALSLLRISTPGWIRMAVWAIIISTNVVFGVLGLMQWIQCWPVAKLWSYELPGSCWPSYIFQGYGAFASAFSGLADITLAILPWRIIWTVAINKKDKIGALLAMSMGVFAGIMPFLKIMTLYSIGNSNATVVDLFIYGTAEPAAAIMAACIPALRALVQQESKREPVQFVTFYDNMVKPLTIVAMAISLAPLRGVLAQSSSFWYANIDHTTAGVRGFAPHLDGDNTYEVFKVVTPSGGGAAIQQAINEGSNGTTRHGMWFASQPRVVYLLPGEYLVDKTIRMNTDTILMGDATNPPILKAVPGFLDDTTLLSGQDPTTGISGELSFAIGLKNIILDTTSIPANESFTVLWWGVAQGSQLQNVKIIMPQSPDGQHGHSGIRLGRGSTLGLSDVHISGGLNGIWHDGHQQALYKSITFHRNTIGMLITGGSTISLISPVFDTVGIAIHQTGGYPWIAIIDAISTNSGVTFRTETWPSFLIENLSKDTDSDIVQGPGDYTFPSQPHLSRLSYANTVDRDPIYGPDDAPHTRPSYLAPGGRYPVFPAPNYADLPAFAFLNVKDPAQNGGYTILGDSSRDESASLNKILELAARRHKIAYFPFGKYRVDSTLHIPPGSRIVGEAWATISGFGPFFSDSNNPKPVVQVGRPGDVGTAHIQDMRFTVSEVLPGAIILQFHIAGLKPGDVAVWNSMVTIGGVRGAAGVTENCNDAANQCKAAFMGIHLAETSSVYVENVWNWVADHITEDFAGGSNIAAGRGVLVESKKGTWLYALGSEHWWLYQLGLVGAEGVVVGMLQSETNYDQGDNNPMVLPAPWELEETKWGDPGFEWCEVEDKRCRMGMANWWKGGRDVYSYASASWAFFSGPGYQRCKGEYECQGAMHVVGETPGNLNAFGLCSKDAEVTLRLADGRGIVTRDGFTGGWPGGGGDVGRYTPEETM